MFNVLKPLTFEWDDGNSRKNTLKHSVLNHECQEIFDNQPLIITDDFNHSQQENRYHALGKTNLERLLQISFTIRNGKIRIISARAMSRKERSNYEADSTL